MRGLFSKTAYGKTLKESSPNLAPYTTFDYFSVDWDEDPKAEFLKMQFGAQHQYYQDYYPDPATTNPSLRQSTQSSLVSVSNMRTAIRWTGCYKFQSAPAAAGCCVYTLRQADDPSSRRASRRRSQAHFNSRSVMMSGGARRITLSRVSW